MAGEVPCPRCDYDLSGQVAAWPADRCPLEGLCSECGLSVRWRDVLNPCYRILHGHFEHAARRRIRALFRTIAATFRPWRLWSWLRMSHGIVWGRILVMLPLAMLAGHLLLGLPIGIARATLDWGLWSRMLQLDYFAFAVGLLWPYHDWSWWTGGPDNHSPPGITLVCAIICAVSPLTFLLIPQTLRQARVRRAHLLRIWLYLLPSVAIMIDLPAFLEMLDESLALRTGIYWLCYPDRRNLLLTTLAASAAWVHIWWWCAARRYLRLPRAFAIAACMTTISLLVAILLALALAALSPEFEDSLMDLLA